MADRMTLLLIGGYVSAVALGAYELQRVPSIPGVVSSQAARDLPPLEITPDAIKSIEAFGAIVERPLFDRNRQPPAIIQNADAAQPTVRVRKTEHMRLTAVLKEADKLTALVEDQTGQTRILHQGDKLGEWLVAEILDDRIVIESEGSTKTLEVHHFDPVVTNRATRRLPPATKRQITRRPSAANTPRTSSNARRPVQTPAKP